MLSPGQIYVARAVGGFLLLAHVVGMLFYVPDFSGLSGVYSVVVVAALSVFCFLPRSLLLRLRGLAFALAAAAICATIAVAYKDITLINGADYGALVLRSGLIGVLIIMLMESRSQGAKPHDEA